MQVLRVINCAYFNALFVGEEAVDAGGPSREYWQLIVQAVGSEYCCGMEGNMAIDRPYRYMVYTCMFSSLDLKLKMIGI